MRCAFPLRCGSNSAAHGSVKGLLIAYYKVAQPLPIHRRNRSPPVHSLTSHTWLLAAIGERHSRIHDASQRSIDRGLQTHAVCTAVFDRPARFFSGNVVANNLPVVTIGGCWHCRRIATRLNTPLQYLDGDCYEGMFHMSKMHRISLEQETKVLSECSRLLLSSIDRHGFLPSAMQCWVSATAAANRMVVSHSLSVINQ